MTDRLITLKAKRDALDAEIRLIEDGIRKATYDASMMGQLVTINDARRRDGKPMLSMSEFCAGAEGERG